MAEVQVRNQQPVEIGDIGGLKFKVLPSQSGATLAVLGTVKGQWSELFRFSDYTDDPHYHAPVGGWFAIDRATKGEPLRWWMTKLTGSLPEWLEDIGFADVLPSIDPGEIARHADELETAMTSCIPEEWERISGYGVKRVSWEIDQSQCQIRNLTEFEFGGLRFMIYFDRDLGVSMRIFLTSGKKTELLRLDDYDGNPHYHAPVGSWAAFDRDTFGEPLAWYVAQIRDHLPELLTNTGYASIVPTIDFAEVTQRSQELYDAIAAHVPQGTTRIPGVGLVRDTEQP